MLQILKKVLHVKTFGCDKNSVIGKYFLANIVVHCRICCRNMSYINRIFCRVMSYNFVVDRTYLTNVENTKFIANSWL